MSCCHYGSVWIGKILSLLDTIWVRRRAETLRRESLLRMLATLFGQMDKPDVDHIAVCRRLLYRSKNYVKESAIHGGTGKPTINQAFVAYRGYPHYSHLWTRDTVSTDQIVDKIICQKMAPELKRVLAPIVFRVRSQRGEWEPFEDLKEGFSCTRVDGEVRSSDESIVLDKKYKHTYNIELVDRIAIKEGSIRTRPY